MAEQTLQTGNIVLHPSKPEWGPGRILRTERDRAFIIWRDRGIQEARPIVTSQISLELAPDQNDPTLDEMAASASKPRKTGAGRGGRSPKPAKPVVSVQQAIEAFMKRFPLGFKDPDYVGEAVKGKRRERAYKLQAHKDLIAAVGDGQYEKLLADDPAELCKRMKRVMSSTNLIYSIEQAAFSQGMDDLDRSVPFFRSLWDFLNESTPSEQGFVNYIDAMQNLPVLGNTQVTKWTNATIFPFLYKPDIHIFLKPKVTQNAARGVGIHLNYKPSLNWLTYSRLLEMGEVLLEQLRPMGAEDMIDVQSFIWVCYGGYKVS